MKIPHYLQTFKCIGGACEDNCCIGWDVDIDQSTYEKYQRVTQPVMKREFQRYVKKNPHMVHPSINYAFVVLTEEKKCSFLNADHLCMIQKHLGETYLSNVCDSFPRITNRIDGNTERFATASCPEVARMLVFEPEAMNLVEVAEPHHMPLITYDLKQNAKNYRGKLLQHLLVVRNRCVRFVDEEEDLMVALYKMGHYLTHLATLEMNGTLNLMNNWKAPLIGSNRLHRFPFILPIQEELIRQLMALGISDSPRYVELTEHAEKGDLIKGASRLEQVLTEHPHVLKNYFKNHLYKNLFPFSEGANVEEGYQLLLVRYGIIIRQLMGLAGSDSAFGLNEIAEYLQVFSKVIEHHKHFETEMAMILKKKRIRLMRDLLEVPRV